MDTRLLPAVMTIADFSAWARMGRTRIYEEIASGALYGRYVDWSPIDNEIEANFPSALAG